MILTWAKTHFIEAYNRYESAKGCKFCSDMLRSDLLGEVAYTIKTSRSIPDGFDLLKYEDRRRIMDTIGIVNTHSCVNCTLKHLASAIVEMGELRKGYWGTDHEIFCMGNLTEASEQIDAHSNEMAMELRELRIDIFETQKLVTEEHLAQAKKIFWKIRKIADPDVQIKAVESIKVSKNMQNHYRAAQAQAQLDVKIGVKPSGCGCKRRSAEAVPNRQ
jgi:squalene cyclase